MVLLGYLSAPCQVIAAITDYFRAFLQWWGRCCYTGKNTGPRCAHARALVNTDACTETASLRP